jgi:hypothetical protein
MEVVEADVPELAAIAQRCLPKTEISDPPRDWDFTPQVRLCELLCWARRWYEAGLVMEAAIECASAGSLNRKALVLSRAHLAAGAYLQGGHMADAERVYHVAADMAASETMLRHLRTEFQHLAHIIANAPEHIDDLPQGLTARSGWVCIGLAVFVAGRSPPHRELTVVRPIQPDAEVTSDGSCRTVE